MWTCPKCWESVEDGLDVCSNCETGPDGTKDPAFCVVDPETAEALRAQPPESPNPYAPAHRTASGGADPGLKGMYKSIRFLAFASGLGAVVTAFQFLLALRAYLTRPRPTGGFAALVRQVSVEEILGLASGAFVVAFASMAYLLWSYARSVRELLNEEQLIPGKVMAPQSRFWRRARAVVGCSILIGVVIALYMFKFGGR